jgi:glucoamylase
MDFDERIDVWIERQARHCARLMEASISATGLRHQRPAFGHVVVPAKGSVLASPESAAWDPLPDYFFHWVRDSAMVMSAVVDLWNMADTTAEKERWRGHFEAFIGFSAALLRNDAAEKREKRVDLRSAKPEVRKFLRPESELRALRGDRLLSEPRFNPDGSLDIYRWSRPQYDGPALRALASMRYAQQCRTEGLTPPEELWPLLGRDLDFTVAHADEPCVGPWEEADQVGHHYYVALVQLGAIFHGRSWLNEAATSTSVTQYDAAEAKLRMGLDRHWSADHQTYVAIRGYAGESRDEGLDAALILAVLDADLPSGRHSVMDERVQLTVAAIEDMFAREFPINRQRPDGHAPALGRNRNDRYFGGGAWYPTTLGAAGFYYRLADRVRSAAREADHVAALIRRGDAVMSTVRRYTPADGTLSEQFDRTTGEPMSARNLAWSYAAFIAAAHARKRVVPAI